MIGYARYAASAKTASRRRSDAAAANYRVSGRKHMCYELDAECVPRRTFSENPTVGPAFQPASSVSIVWRVRDTLRDRTTGPRYTTK